MEEKLTLEKKKQNFANKIQQLYTQPPIKSSDYYFITFLGSEDGKLEWHCYTRFERYTEEKPIREIRVPREIDPIKMIQLMTEIKEPAFIINSKEDLVFFMHLGGHAIIEKNLAEEAFPDIVKPAQMISIYPIGMENIENLSMENLNHFPTPKMRMKVLNRDKRKCRLCGRSPQDYEDLELQIHHIQPWADYGGITQEENLITLCKPCHMGLDPHYDPSLFKYVERTAERVTRVMNRNKLSYEDGVKNFRLTVKKFLAKRISK